MLLICHWINKKTSQNNTKQNIISIVQSTFKMTHTQTNKHTLLFIQAMSAQMRRVLSTHPWSLQTKSPSALFIQLIRAASMQQHNNWPGNRRLLSDRSPPLVNEAHWILAVLMRAPPRPIQPEHVNYLAGWKGSGTARFIKCQMRNTQNGDWQDIEIEGMVVIWWMNGFTWNCRTPKGVF